jgi:hypothetical protein
MNLFRYISQLKENTYNMNKKSPLTIPTIDVVKIIEQSYFDNIKRRFLSLDYIYYGHGTSEEGTAEILDIDLKIDEVKTMYEDPDEDSCSYGEYIFYSYNFYSDYFIPGIEKGKSTYLSNFKKEIQERINHKDVILVDLFSHKKSEINNLLLKNINKEIKSDLQIFIEEKWNSILDEMNLLEEKHFPSPKLSLSLSKSECLLLFYSLYQKGVFSKDTNRADLGRFLDRNITYKKGDKNLVVSHANDDLGDLLPSIKTGVVRQPISNTSLNRLEKIEDRLFDFLKK